MILSLALAACSLGTFDTGDVDALTNNTQCDSPPEAGPRLLRRLTHAQYDATVSTWLGSDAAPGQAFASDNVEGWFDNHADALLVTSLLADQYRSAAEALAFEAPIDTLLSCDPEALGPAECALVFVDEMGLQAFRRPLNSSDLQRYHSLWEEIAREDGFTEGLRWVLSALLQSPHFLYRMELGVADETGDYRLTSWEVASELSYGLWGAPPDAELMAAAEDDALQTPEELADQVNRMAQDPSLLAAQTWRFVEDWLFLDQLAWVTKDSETYPGFSDVIRQDMSDETRLFVGDLVQTGAALSDLLVADHSYQTAELADWYGHAEPSGTPDDLGFYRVGVNSGLLTHGSLLATHSLPDSSSPVHRGVVVRERLFCQELPPPPSNADVSAPAVDPETSTRDRYEQHTSDPSCSGCHDLIDPLGFGFEAFDGVGRWRDNDNGHAIDDSGAITATSASDGPYVGLFELSQMLAESEDVSLCATEMWLSWSTGQSDQDCAAQSLAQGSLPSETGLVEPLLRQIELASFTVRVGGGDEFPTLAQGQRVDLDSVLIETGGDYSDPVPDTLVWSIDESSSWTEGYCSDGAVTNTSTESVSWSIQTSVQGSVDNIWNAIATPVDDELLFVGESWNDTLGPGETTTFGFCASL
jgi:hypothetical protein